ncbi:MAG: hypothetical protein ACLFQS_10515 [Bacteroidales bacterium]
MNKLMRTVTGIFAMMLLAMTFTSCEEESVEYQVRLYNRMENELLGFPFLKYDVIEFTVGDQKIENVALNEFSDYVPVMSGSEHPIKVKVQEYTYDPDGMVYRADEINTYDLGTEEWGTEDEYVEQVIQLKIGPLLSGYEPVYTVHYDN